MRIKRTMPTCSTTPRILIANECNPLAGLVVVLMLVAQKIADLFDLVKRLFDF